MERHQASSQHQTNVIKWLRTSAASVSSGGGLEALEATDALAPQTQPFQELLESVRHSGNPPWSNRKMASMAWCLFEAQRDQERDFLAKAAAISVSQDERKGILLCRYIASSETLEVRTGVLFCSPFKGSGAPAVREAFLSGLRRFCTARRGASQRVNAIQARPKFNECLCVDVRKKVFLYNVDGGSDEQLAGKLLQPGSGRQLGPDELKDKLPGLIFITKDKAHASRLLLTRTFSKDPYLKGMLDVTLHSPGAIVKLIQYSPNVQEIFKDYQKSVDSAEGLDAAIANFSFSAVRWDSTQKPLARAVLYFDALLQTAMQLVRDRSKCETVGARQWLSAVDEEFALQLAMLADLSDESIRLTRFLDREHFDIAALPSELLRFKDRVVALFFGGGCLNVERGFTVEMLRQLGQPRLIVIPGERPRTLGGPAAVTPDIKQRCLNRMRAMAKLMLDVLGTEFPQWELLQCFSVLRVDHTVGAADVKADCRLMRLCKAFNLEHSRAAEELGELLPLAARVTKDHPDLPTVQVWARILQEVQATTRRREVYKLTALLPLLTRFAAWSASTSGVEQNFSRIKKLIGEQRGAMHSDTLERAAVLALSQLPAALELDLPVHAQLVWSKTFHPPRGVRQMKSLPTRPSVLQKKKLNNRSEKQWIHKRRASADQLACRASDTCIVPPADMWSAKHETEHKRQSAELQKKRLEVLSGPCNYLLETDLAKDDQEQVLRHQAKRIRLNHEYGLKEARLEKSRAGPVILKPPPGQRVFLGSGGEDGIVQAAIRSSAYRQVYDLCEADAFVFADPASAGGHVRLCAAWKGAMVLSFAYLCSGKGPVLKYKKASCRPRYLWISPSVQSSDHGSVQLLRKLIAHIGSRWCEVSREDLLSRRRSAKSGYAELVALVRSAEKKSLPQTYSGSVMTLREFTESICELEQVLTGICGR